MNDSRHSGGERRVLARYQSADGARELVAEHISGHVHLSDLPADQPGAAHVIEPRVGCLKELDALVQDYLVKAEALGRCPMAPAAWRTN